MLLGVFMLEACEQNTSVENDMKIERKTAITAELEEMLTAHRQKMALVDIEIVTNLLELYRLDAGTYPSTEPGLKALFARPPNAENWRGPYGNNPGVLLDPWHHPLLYRNPSRRGGKAFDLCSYGARGQLDGAGEDTMICN